jgi:hypothetical protein
MRRFPLGLMAGLLSAACVGLFVVGCGGPADRDDEPLPRKKGGKGGAQVAVQVETLKPLPVAQDKYAGTISGSVKWAGDRPDFDALTQALQKGMIKDTDYCLRGKAGGETVPIHDYETFQQTYRIGDNGNLGNVFVWIAAPAGFAFDVPDAQLPAVKDVRLHQPHCAFLPHCQVLFAGRYKKGEHDATGCQKLVILNDARVTHNAKVQGGPLNGTVNKILGPWDGKNKMNEEILELRPEKDPVTVSCDVHTWMRAYVRVFDHPYAAVTSVGANLSDAKKLVFENAKDPKYGTFEIKGAPIGAKVRLFVWHEQLGHLAGNNGKEITIDADPAKNTFVFDAKMK